MIHQVVLETLFHCQVDAEMVDEMASIRSDSKVISKIFEESFYGVSHDSLSHRVQHSSPSFCQLLSIIIGKTRVPH